MQGSTSSSGNQCDQMFNFKVAQFPPKVTKYVPSHSSFYLNSDFLKEAKRSPNIWAFFERKFVINNFLWSPNLITLVANLSAEMEKNLNCSFRNIFQFQISDIDLSILGPCKADSVTRLGEILNFLVTNLLTKVAQILW